jgi:hypothetical protein
LHLAHWERKTKQNWCIPQLLELKEHLP